MDAHEALDAVHRAQHPLDAAIAGRRHAGIMGMQRQLDLVFRGHRHHPLQEIGDALPEHIARHHARLGQGQILGRVGQFPGGI